MDKHGPALCHGDRAGSLDFGDFIILLQNFQVSSRFSLKFRRMAAALGLGSAVTTNVIDIICSFLGRPWSVVASSGADVNDIGNLADLESYDQLGYYPAYPVLYLDSAEREVWLQTLIYRNNRN